MFHVRQCLHAFLTDALSVQSSITILPRSLAGGTLNRSRALSCRIGRTANVATGRMICHWLDPVALAFVQHSRSVWKSSLEGNLRTTLFETTALHGSPRYPVRFVLANRWSGLGVGHGDSLVHTQSNVAPEHC